MSRGRHQWALPVACTAPQAPDENAHSSKHWCSWRAGGCPGVVNMLGDGSAGLGVHHGIGTQAASPTASAAWANACRNLQGPTRSKKQPGHARGMHLTLSLHFASRLDTRTLDRIDTCTHAGR